MKDFYFGKELDVVCFFQEVPVEGKIFLLSNEEELLVWKTSLKFLSVISYTGDFFAKVGGDLFQFEVLSINEREITFTTQKPRLINDEILKRQNLRVTTSEERPVKLLVGDRKIPPRKQFLAYLPCNEIPLLEVYDISVGGIGLLFEEDVKFFKLGKKIKMKLFFFRKVGGGTEIKEKEIPVSGEVVRKEKLGEDIVKVGIKFVDLYRFPEYYRFVFNYIIQRQREIRKQMEYLMSELNE